MQFSRACSRNDVLVLLFFIEIGQKCVSPDFGVKIVPFLFRPGSPNICRKQRFRDQRLDKILENPQPLIQLADLIKSQPNENYGPAFFY